MSTQTDALPPRYNPRSSEAKWQAVWAERGVFNTPEANGRPDYFVLEMFPYPSGNIHMGHVRNYALGDVTARFRRARGYNVLYPMGWDAFGLPAENAAIQRGVHPGAWTKQNIATMREQLKSIGLSYDWSREVMTCDPGYYQHEQRFFLQMLDQGLAYRKEAVVNWDPVDNTVLANEQVIDGRGWRSGAVVERRTLSQWFLQITDFAEDLLAGLDTLTGWPDKVRLMQEKWIGKSSGCTLTLVVAGGKSPLPPRGRGLGEGDAHKIPLPSSAPSPSLSPVGGEEQVGDIRSNTLEIYTTRPDTLYGMSFVAIAPDHPIAKTLATGHPPLATFLTECAAVGTSEEAIEKAEKKGFDTGLKVIHPFTGEEFPVYVANFVLMEYGTGAVFGCPAHDERDYEFAVKYGLAVKQVVAPKDSGFGIQDSGLPTEILLPFTEDGILVNSPPLNPESRIPTRSAAERGEANPPSLNGLTTAEAKEAAIAELEKRGVGKRKINYRLRDWGISRQRYWGCPIPIIYCDDCGAVPVPESQLPVTLPEDVTFDTPGNPLAHHPTWKHVDCPACSKPAVRETDTFDTFFESSWYFASFASGGGNRGIDAAAAKRWLPVNQYIGGIEHAVLHLLYARFFTRALTQCGVLDVAEPFAGLMTQGMIGHATFKDSKGDWVYPADVTQDSAGNWQLANGEAVTRGRSEKMSKSKKNTVDPRGLIEAYGADAARLFMLSDSPPERDLEWTDAGIDGAWRYVQRVYKLVCADGGLDPQTPAPHAARHGRLRTPEPTPEESPATGHSPLAAALLKLTHKTIDAVTKDIEAFHFNKAVARIRELTNFIEKVSSGAESHPESQIPNPGPFRFALETVLHLLAPMMPHLAEECWAALGHSDLIASRAWPVADPAYLVDETVTVAVQVNGKLRATLELAKDVAEDIARETALTHPNVLPFVEGKTIKKTVVVPNRIVNVVVV